MKALWVIILSLILVSCSSHGDDISVGYVPVLVNLPLFVAAEEGLFEKYGLEVELVEAQSPNHIADALVTGHLDAAGVLAYPVLFALESKRPGSVLLYQSAEETQEQYVASILVLENSSAQEISDLAGKRIGVYSGIVQVVFLRSILHAAGIPDYSIVEISPRLQLQGLLAGHYDALSTVEPFVTIGTQVHDMRVLVENPRVTYIQDPFPSVATPIARAFVSENPDLADNFILAMDEAVEFIQSNPEAAKMYLLKYTPISEEQIPFVQLPHFLQHGEKKVASVQKYANWLYEQSLLDVQVNVSEMFAQ